MAIILSDEDIHLSQMVRNFIELDDCSSSSSSSSSFPCCFNNPSDYETLQVEFFDQNPTSFLSLQVRQNSDACVDLGFTLLYLWMMFSFFFFFFWVYFKEILESVTDSEAEILGKILFYWREVMNLEAEKLRKWIVNRLRMDEYEASLCKTSWVTTFARPSGIYFSTHFLPFYCFIYILICIKFLRNDFFFQK